MPLFFGIERALFTYVATVLTTWYFVSKVVYSTPPLDLSIGGGSPEIAVNPSTETITPSSFDSSFDESCHVITFTANDVTDQGQADFADVPSQVDYVTTDYIYTSPRTEYVTSDPRIQTPLKTANHDPLLSTEQIKNIITDINVDKENIPAGLPHRQPKVTLTGTRVADIAYTSLHEETGREVMVYEEQTPSFGSIIRWTKGLFKIFGEISLGTLLLFLVTPIISIVLSISALISNITAGRTATEAMSMAEYTAKLKKEKAKLTAVYWAQLEKEKAKIANVCQDELEAEVTRLTDYYEARLERDREAAEHANLLAEKNFHELTTNFVKELERNEKSETRYQSMLKRESDLKNELDRVQLEYSDTQDLLSDVIRNNMRREKSSQAKSTEDKKLIEQKDENIRSLTAQVEYQGVDVAKLQAIVEKQDKDLSEIDTIIRSRDKSISDQKAAIHRQSEDLEKSRADILHRDQIIADQRAIMDKYDEDLDEKDAIITSKDGEIANQQITIERLQGAAIEAQKEIDAKDHNSKLLIRRKAAWLKESERMKKESTDSSKKQSLLEGELRESKMRNDMLKKRLDEVCKQRLALTDKADRLERDMEEHREVCPMVQAGTIQASGVTEQQSDVAEKNTETEQSLPVPETEVRRSDNEARGKVQTIDNDIKATVKVKKGLVGTTSVLEPRGNNSGPAASNTGENEMTAGASDKMRIGSDLTVHLAESNDMTDETVEDNKIIEVQQPTAGETTGNTKDQGHEDTTTDDQNITPSRTFTAPRKQIHSRGFRSPCAQCKSANLDCDKHKIPCNSCFKGGIECSREQPDQAGESPVVDTSHLIVKVSKLAIKLKKDIPLEKPLDEIQRLLDEKMCPICEEPGHIASKCPEHPMFAKKDDTKKDDTTKDDIQPSVTVIPEPVIKERPTKPTAIEINTTIPQAQSAPHSPTKSPLIVGGTDESLTDTIESSDDNQQTLNQSRWADGTSIITPTTPSTNPPAFTRGQNPAAATFMPRQERPSSSPNPLTHNPITGFPFGNRKPVTPTTPASGPQQRPSLTHNPITGYTFGNMPVGNSAPATPTGSAQLPPNIPRRQSARYWAAQKVNNEDNNGQYNVNQHPTNQFNNTTQPCPTTRSRGSSGPRGHGRGVSPNPRASETWRRWVQDQDLNRSQTSASDNEDGGHREDDSGDVAGAGAGTISNGPSGTGLKPAGREPPS